VSRFPCRQCYHIPAPHNEREREQRQGGGTAICHLNQREPQLPARLHNVALLARQQHGRVGGLCHNIIAVKFPLPRERWLDETIIAASGQESGL
jgi:hypothetical protein